MCGIWALFGASSGDEYTLSFKKIKHRGPDAWRIEYDNRLTNSLVGFHRLAIIDCLYGMQPMKIHRFPKMMVICNGEIYNHKRLQRQYDFEYETKCDVECILHLYNKFGIDGAVKSLDGVFAFCLIDMEKGRVFLARDPYGVRPLFRFYSDANEVLALCSEAKGITSFCSTMNEHSKLTPFTPGTWEEYSLKNGGHAKFCEMKQYFQPGCPYSFLPAVPPSQLVDTRQSIATLFTEACRKRLMADRRIGCLLSGGLDSSLVAALVTKLAKEINLPYQIETFAIGMEGSPDLLAARKVADFIKSKHHEIVFGDNDVAQHLDNVIYHLESFDITTVRASVGMYLLAKYIQENTETTVIFSGEGADELAQGYIYFRDAPDSDSAHDESVRLLSDIYLYDGLRADRTTSAFSLELRCPFLDIQFTNYYLNLPKDIRQPHNGLEKYLLRSAFEGQDLLPDCILWRHKEAFSDGVASRKRSLFTVIQDIIDARVTDDEFTQESKSYKQCVPKTKEAYYYRKVFNKSFSGLDHFIPYFWMPKWIEVSDPSARYIKHYAATEE